MGLLGAPAACYAVPVAHTSSPLRIASAIELKGGGGDWRNLVIGPLLQCMEAATLGMPFEVCT